MERKIQNKVKGSYARDGAGVKLVRVLSIKTTKEYDPILMLDSFDSTNPDDYIAGFPDHPHRGIETISYVYKGAMTHRDSIGSEDTIVDGQVQWMTAGSGIIHSESLPASERLLGVQLWLNLPAKDKMTTPNYKAIKNDEIKEIKIENGMIRLLAGSYGEYQGYKSMYLPLDYYDVHLNQGGKITIPTKQDKSITLFTLVGNPCVAGEKVDEKTAIKLTEGDSITIDAKDEDVQVLYISSDRLDESIACGGPIVMNTREELDKAMDELREGTFIKKETNY